MGREIRNRELNRKEKFLIIYMPTNWPEGERAHFIIESFEYPSQAYVRREELRKQDQGAEILAAKRIDFDVTMVSEL